MTGLKGFIRDYIPSSWEHVLLKEKKLTVYVNYVYRDTPKTMKGLKGYKRGKSNIKLGFKRCPIHETFQASNSKEGLLYWVSINNKIKDYEHNCN